MTATNNNMFWKFNNKDMRTGKLPTDFDLSSTKKEKGLKIPEGEGVWMDVAGERRKWEEGKVVTINTSFVHSTSNKSSEDRYVLIIDFWHPGLTPVERKCLEYVYDLRNKFERGEIPVRELRKSYNDNREPEGKGVKGIWGALTGKK
ncbi:hypothetical protein TrLO_g3416 [Triparma laevis f. longispina]|uniref:Aspartyl/asparaginy/proline hydroxylase domain-containing protein n=1 Tax=Triparma laevis f. longispina TaxID=1714387 RepID=A0A9W7FAA1_9STRA|nr:hypothetical protein TrLO_g3416 [Triparma laevis f. longispina]